MILHIVFDGPPGPIAGRFVEVETPDGRGIRVGQWIERENGLWALVLDVNETSILHVTRPQLTDF